MTTALAIMAGGLGALLRYVVAGAIQRWTGSSSPWGTAVVNIAGAALLGAVGALAAAEHVTDTVLLIVGSGFAGGLTTFSTWMVETVQLVERPTSHQAWAAVVNVLGMLLAGLAAVAATDWLLVA